MFKSFTQILLFLVAGFITLVLVLRTYNTFKKRLKRKGRLLADWAKGIEFTNSQLVGMRALWQWYKTGRRPTADPLSHIDALEIADLIKKCELTFLPERFHLKDEAKLRQKMMAELSARGMHDLQAQVVVGMKFGLLGPANAAESNGGKKKSR